MIAWLSDWAGAIIIAVMIATIIEMILPEGNSKKYIKVVIGVYILFTIISPVMTKFTGKSLAVSDLLDLNDYIDEIKQKEMNQNILLEENSASIRDIYIGNLKADIQNKLKGKGYVVTSIALEVEEDENYALKKITLSAHKEDNGDDVESENTNTVGNCIDIVNTINISVTNTTNVEKEKTETKSNLSGSDKKKMKEYLSSVYEIQEKNIKIE